jgi:hypothetical protein
MAAAELRDFFWKIAERFRVRDPEGLIYAERQRYRWTRGPTPPPGVARRGARQP